MLRVLQRKPQSSCWLKRSRSPPQVLMSLHGTELKPLEGRGAGPPLRRRSSTKAHGGSVLSTLVIGKYDLRFCKGLKHAVTKTDDGVDRITVCGVYLVVQVNACDALGVHVDSLRAATGLLLQACWLDIVHEAHFALDRLGLTICGQAGWRGAGVARARVTSTSSARLRVAVS